MVKRERHKNRLPPFVPMLLSTIDCPAWGDALSDYQQTAEGFIASLRNDGCFDAVLPYTARLPFRTKLAVSVTGNRDNRSRRKACFRSRFHCHGTRAVLKCGHGSDTLLRAKIPNKKVVRNANLASVKDWVRVRRLV